MWHHTFYGDSNAALHYEKNIINVINFQLSMMLNVTFQRLQSLNVSVRKRTNFTKILEYKDTLVHVNELTYKCIHYAFPASLPGHRKIAHVFSRGANCITSNDWNKCMKMLYIVSVAERNQCTFHFVTEASLGKTKRISFYENWTNSDEKLQNLITRYGFE